MLSGILLMVPMSPNFKVYITIEKAYLMEWCLGIAIN